MPNAIEDVLSQTMDELERLLADDKTAQEYAKTLCSNDQHPTLVRPLTCMPGHAARIEIAKTDF